MYIDSISLKLTILMHFTAIDTRKIEIHLIQLWIRLWFAAGENYGNVPANATLSSYLFLPFSYPYI